MYNVLSPNDIADICEVLNMRMDDSDPYLMDLPLFDPTTLTFQEVRPGDLDIITNKNLIPLAVYRDGKKTNANSNRKKSALKYFYKCQCGRVNFATISNMKNSVKCSPRCETPMTRTVKNFMINNGLAPTFTYFAMNKQALTFICSCGSGGEKLWKTLKGKPSCISCRGYKKKESYENVKEIFNKEGYELLSTEYNGVMDSLQYKCPQGHISETTLNRFKNTSQSKGDIKKHRCPECNRLSKMKPKEQVEEILKAKNFVLIETFSVLNKDGKNINRITFLCDYDHIVTVNRATILRGDFVCTSCHLENQRYDYEFVSNYFKEQGCELLAKEYKSRDTPMEYKCECGNNSTIRFRDFKMGKRCQVCKVSKYIKTCQEKYGVDNIFQLEETKIKSQETNIKKLGVPFPMQNKEIREKAEQTCLLRYNVRWMFTLPYVYEKIRKSNLEKYGKEFPLQVEEIQTKINLIFLQKYGATRPFLSKEFIKKYNQMMIDRYGTPWFVQSDYSKKLMNEKYNSDYYISSEKFTQTMIENYKVPHALQCPELFHKQIKSCFRQKKYTSPDGGFSWMVLGYEGECIDKLIQENNIPPECIRAGDDLDIPVIDYVTEYDGKSRKWYPDIWIPHQQKIIEVKSDWTYNKDPIMNKNKMEYSPYDCEMWIFDGKRNIKEMIIKRKDEKDFIYLIGNYVLLGEKIGVFE